MLDILLQGRETVLVGADFPSAIPKFHDVIVARTMVIFHYPNPYCRSKNKNGDDSDSNGGDKKRKREMERILF